MIVQGCWSDDRIVCEWTVEQPTLELFPFDAFNPNVWKEKAITEARIFCNEPTFEGDYVRVITDDGELVWDSRNET